MGMFTTITHDSKPYQIKTGADDCEMYGVGDEVDWRVYPDCAGKGKLLDGVYHGFCALKNDDSSCWVVIKERKVEAVVFDESENAYAAIVEKFGIVDPPKSLWTDEAWKRHREIEAKAREEFEAAIALFSDLPPLEQATAAFVHCTIRKTMSEPGLTRQILKEVEIGDDG